MRAPARKPPANVLGPHDGTTLEDVIGQLQSEWGVPQNPQEFRITLKFGDGREGKPDGSTTIEEVRADSERDETVGTGSDGRKREKAPAAPRMGASATEGEGSTRKSSRRRRSRKRKRR